MNYRRIPLYLFLALFGLIVGEYLPSFIIPNKVVKLAVMGEDLVAANVSPGGQHVVGFQIKGSEWFVCAFDFKGKQLVQPLPIEPSSGFTSRIAWSADGNRCAVAGSTVVVVLDFQQGQVKVRELPAVWQVRELRFRGQQLLARCNDTVLIWDSQLQLRWRVGADSVLHADLTADGRYLAVGLYQSGVFLADLQKRKVIRQFDRGRTPAFLRFSKKDQQMTAGFRNPKDRSKDFVVTYNHLTGKPVSAVITLPSLYTCEISDDGSTLLLTADSGCSTWDVASSTLRCKPKFKSGVRDTLGPDGKFALSFSGGKEGLVIWDTRTGTVREKLKAKGKSTWLNIGDSNHLVAVSAGKAHLWRYQQ